MPNWQGSDRRSRLPKDWPKRRAYVLRRDGYRCRFLMSGGYRCPAGATDVDHVIPNDDHSYANLRAMCEEHHDRKSASEGGRARQAQIRARRRPPEPHPGAIIPR